MLIWVFYTLLIKEAITLIIAGGEEVDIGIMFVLSCCAFLLNIFKICIAGGHTHGGGGEGKKGHEHGGKSHGSHDAPKEEKQHAHGGKSHGSHGGPKPEKPKEHSHGGKSHGSRYP